MEGKQWVEDGVVASVTHNVGQGEKEKGTKEGGFESDVTNV